MMTAWSMHRVGWRVLSPLHIGTRATARGFLKYSRPYVHGLSLRGALVAALARSLNTAAFEEIAVAVDRQVAMTYLYPTAGALLWDEALTWPWERREEFEWRFLASELIFARELITDATGAEIEYIAPLARDGQPVYLQGYCFVRGDCELPWRDALAALQLGGERNRGWGRTRLVLCEQVSQADVPCFGYQVTCTGELPTIAVPAGYPLLAHAPCDPGLYARGAVSGDIEPLLGRESQEGGKIGQVITAARLCWVPGSIADEALRCSIEPRGLWGVAPAANGARETPVQQ